MNAHAVQNSVPSTEGNLIDLYVEFPVGATGAVGTAVRSRYITAITRLGAGNYRLALDGSVDAILEDTLRIFDVTPGATDGQVIIPSVRTVGATSSPVYEFFCYQQNGTAADPRNGASIFGRLRVRVGPRV